MVRSVWAVDGLNGFYRGVTPGVLGSLATAATYFGVIESTKKWIEEVNPNLSGHWSHFIAGAIGKEFLDLLATILMVVSHQIW
ncbi:S-adenosylmethionine mitochondrial carrier protein [Iris pallida]|nr:S-adenosylmethionine mitochondrial carrier protein [Iris pallida]